MNYGKGKFSTWAYIAPFIVFLAFLAIKGILPFGPGFEYPLRVIVVSAALVVFSRNVIPSNASTPIKSTLCGAGIFIIWVLPDVIWPSYRSHWLFQNSFTGTVTSSLPDNVRLNATFLIFRIVGTAIIVPIIEELFWRGWLMRYLIDHKFEMVRLGAYSTLSFWLPTVLFASEHGPYWDVGFVVGVAFNLWLIRTRNLADCILAHAVANGCLAVYVILQHQWQYWL
jgi:uncharacterized protein